MCAVYAAFLKSEVLNWGYWISVEGFLVIISFLNYGILPVEVKVYFINPWDNFILKFYFFPRAVLLVISFQR